PDGIAHYLEHKMFENENGEDTFERFARFGADANAFTSTDITAYLFSCTQYFKENLAILLEYVTSPYFTPETVAKEQGIIGQEIKMGEDNPHRALYYNMLEALYKDSQAKLNVAGTVESISHITAELLYSCYNTFYNLSNMVLIIAGNTTMEEVLSVCDKVLPVKTPVKITRSYNAEQNEVNKKRVKAKFEISKPMFMIGVKNPDVKQDGKALMEQSAKCEMLMDLLFGETSEFSVDVYESGLINGLSSSYDASKVSSYGYISGECDDAEKVYDKFIRYIEQKKKTGFDKADFDRIKKAKYANYIRTFESSQVAENALFYKICDEDLFEYGDYVKAVKFEDMKPLLCSLFSDEHICMSVVEPISEKGE
ncbi:MAG: insulinase family protein, partial [Clostridiales bacterium]|nr:insulinase family protein [Clostridiales bacterium]